MLKILNLKGFVGTYEDVLPAPVQEHDLPIDDVKAIIEDVKKNQDEALRRLTEKFDGVKIDDFRLSPDELTRAYFSIDENLREALEKARDSISGYHRHMLFYPQTYIKNGVIIKPLIRPVRRVGIYVPGGRAVYPSTVLMCAIPARVAGVQELVLCVPPKQGADLVDDVVLAAAKLAEIDELYTVGGAQAIAAMAFGTESIKKVDMIVGPGNIYVTTAKRLVAGEVGLPAAFAGPSEVVVLADETANAKCVACDLIVQAEHGPDGLSWLVTTSSELIEQVSLELTEMIKSEPRRQEIEMTLSKNGYAVLTDSINQGVDVVNVIAPEHLEIMCKNAEEIAVGIENAGAVFLGNLSTAAFGDYIAGPSHVLPTFRTARFSAGLTTIDFIRYGHSIEITEEAVNNLASSAIEIAETEGLKAHAKSIKLREEKPC